MLERRRLRIALLATLISTALLYGGWLLLRHSPLVSVQDVQISGVHGREAHEIDAALTAAARRMSTLDVQSGALLASVARFRVVRDVRVSPSFPHGLHITVSEQLPVAALSAQGTRTAVAADGVVLGSALLSSTLPSVAGAFVLGAGEHVHNGNLLAVLSVLGACPGPLAKLVQRAYTGPKGLTIVMQGGLLAYFGDAGRPHAKWLSLARVLADPSSAGASYVDVRLPARPAAGFPAGVSAPGSSEASTEQTSSEQPSSAETPVSSLAAGLTAGTSAGSSASESSTGEPSSTGTPTSTESGEASSSSSPPEGAAEATGTE